MPGRRAATGATDGLTRVVRAVAREPGTGADVRARACGLRPAKPRHANRFDAESPDGAPSYEVSSFRSLFRPALGAPSWLVS
ncbi:hypothetical protein GCM10009654_26560 [Streptomyces hebeiensis]|uniref:Uncharacterized protein n=1 Tax=Streptomyces hebeiensis TaxID=229486 RepID=A0ABN1UTX0_9ACTN